MNRRVIIRPKAEADLCEAQSWYNSKRPGLGDDLLNEVKHSVGFLAEHAEQRPIYYNGFRRVITRRFPYKPEGDRVVLFRILHAKQDPRKHL